MRYKQGILQPGSEEKPYKLPVRDKENQRSVALKLYASLIWRMSNEEDIKQLLNKLYEYAYSNGLSDMDAMHSETDKTTL